MVATGEQAKRPLIHVWDADALAPLAIIGGIHCVGISALAFDGLSPRGVAVDERMAGTGAVCFTVIRYRMKTIASF